MTDIVVPTLGESVSEATVAKWMKKAGDSVRKDETLVELETDKVSVEVSAPEAGVLSEIVAGEGATVTIGALLGRMGGAGAQPAPAAPKAAEAPKPTPAGRGDRGGRRSTLSAASRGQRSASAAWPGTRPNLANLHPRRCGQLQDR